MAYSIQNMFDKLFQEIIKNFNFEKAIFKVITAIKTR